MDHYQGGDNLIHIESDEDHRSNVSRTDKEVSTIMNDRFFKMLSWKIFTWLPAKSVVKFLSTSKECTKFMQEESFCKQQQQNMKLMDDCGFFIQPENPLNYHNPDIPKFFPLLDKKLKMSIPPKSMMFLNKVEVLASCGGLLFCRTTETETEPIEPFLILNPATEMMARVSEPLDLSIPESLYMGLKTVFTYGENDDVLLMVIVPISYDLVYNYKCFVYSPKENIWREKGQPSFTLGTRKLSLESHVFFDGCVYLMSDFCCYPWQEGQEDYFPYIVGYNTNDETTRFLSLPKRARRGRNHFTCQMKIFPWNKSQTMCLVKYRKNLFTVWVWNKDHKKWVQILRKRLSEMGLSEDYESFYEIFTFEVINGKTILIIMSDENVFSYKLVVDCMDEDREGDETATLLFERTGYFDPDLILHPYSNTLRQFSNSFPIS